MIVSFFPFFFLPFFLSLSISFFFTFFFSYLVYFLSSYLLIFVSLLYSFFRGFRHQHPFSLSCLPSFFYSFSSIPPVSSFLPYFDWFLFRFFCLSLFPLLFPYHWPPLCPLISSPLLCVSIQYLETSGGLNLAAARRSAEAAVHMGITSTYFVSLYLTSFL